MGAALPETHSDCVIVQRDVSEWVCSHFTDGHAWKCSYMFHLEFYSNPVLNYYFFFLNANDKNSIDTYNSEDEKISISLFY